MRPLIDYRQLLELRFAVVDLILLQNQGREQRTAKANECPRGCGVGEHSVPNSANARLKRLVEKGRGYREKETGLDGRWGPDTARSDLFAGHGSNSPPP